MSVFDQFLWVANLSCYSAYSDGEIMKEGGE